MKAIPARPLGGLLWAVLPLALYALVLRHLWFNAPIWDDYNAILDSVMLLQDAPDAKAWWHYLVIQHNEHRIAVMRLTSLALAGIAGTMDIRVLVVIGNLAVVGLLVLAWAEFRHAVAAPLFAAAGFLMFQWSYYEASLMGSAALPNIGVVFFSFACLFFAGRSGARAAIACALFGLLAIGSQANGLFALPIATVAAALAGMRRRAVVLALMAAAFWALYFFDYARPLNHPSVFAALGNPLGATQLFLIIIGGIAPVGALILAVLGWLTWKGAWKAHPTAAFWVGFVLLSAAAATAGRIGFGVFHASRYAVYSTCLAIVCLLAICSVTRPWPRWLVAATIVAAATASIGITWISWPRAVQYSREGRLLARVAGAPMDWRQRYVGMLHPGQPDAGRILIAAEQRRLYFAPERAFGSARLTTVGQIPPTTQMAGFIDQVPAVGKRVSVIGWTHLDSATPGREYFVFPGGGTPLDSSMFATARPDVAKAAGNQSLTYAGFRLELEYPSDEEARRAAASLCVFVEAPGQPLTALARTGVECRVAAKP